MTFQGISLQESKRNMWIHPNNGKFFGEYHHLVPQLKCDQRKFIEYFRMSAATFDYTLERLSPMILVAQHPYSNSDNIFHRIVRRHTEIINLKIEEREVICEESSVFDYIKIFVSRLHTLAFLTLCLSSILQSFFLCAPAVLLLSMHLSCYFALASPKHLKRPSLPFDLFCEEA